MYYTYHYKRYQNSKLATFISSLQGSFWGAVAFAVIPALPLFVLYINLEMPILGVLSGIIAIGGTIFIMKINTDKLDRKAFFKKYKHQLFNEIEAFVENVANNCEPPIKIFQAEIDALLQQVYNDLSTDFDHDINEIVNNIISEFFHYKGINNDKTDS